MKIYMAEFYIEENKRNKRMWRISFNAYKTEKECRDNIKNDFEIDFRSTAKDYTLCDYIINEIELHNDKTT